jgi:hypothetical protein
MGTFKRVNAGGLTFMAGPKEGTTPLSVSESRKTTREEDD